MLKMKLTFDKLVEADERASKVKHFDSDYFYNINRNILN